WIRQTWPALVLSLLRTVNDADSRLKLSEVVVQLESEITASTEIKYIKIFCTINPQLLQAGKLPDQGFAP
ncbi:hypothetical protein ACC699_38805, partial [Rhizobium ruizarguesonis]